MIKKLRRRFILIMMSMVTIVLAVTFSVLVISSAQQLREESFRSLEDGYGREATNNENQATDESVPPIEHNDNTFDKHAPFFTFYVTIDEEGEIVTIEDNVNDIATEDIQTAVSSALSQNAAQGSVEDLNLRYIIFQDSSNQRVIGFIDISFEQAFIRKQILDYTLIGLGSLIAFFIISLFLSKIAIKPVDRAWKKQQRFIADASHELKTPITIMLANTSILLSGKNLSKAESNKWLSHIDSEAHHMKKLVEDLLFLARVDAKDADTPLMRMDLSDAALQSSLSFEPVMFESEKELVTAITPDLFINGNQSQIKQLISILLDNACKYAYPNTQVSFQLKNENNKAALSVNNAGDPIEAEDIPHLFDRFYRVDKARTRNADSYGLGLSIAKEIVMVHKGDISVVSNMEEGTTFTVTISIVD